MVALLCITKYSAVTLIDKGKIELYQTATKRDLVHDSCGVIHLSGRPISQIPKCTCPISHNTLIRTETCTFLFWMVYCGVWDKCTVGFVNLVYSSCIVSDEKYKKLFEKTFWVPQLFMGRKYFDTAWVRRDGQESKTTIGTRSVVECVLKCEMEISCRGVKSHSESYVTVCDMFLEYVEFAVWSQWRMFSNQMILGK